MTNRRTFLTGLFAVTLTPCPTWADVGAPAYLAAAMDPSGRYVLCGLRDDGEITFTLPLPGRGHAAAAHPVHPHAVAFARRPGRFALVIDCQNGQERARFDAPEGRHFYGHGCFSPNGDRLFTTENDYDNGRGVIGVWDTTDSYRRIGEFMSGGIGPHDLQLMPDGNALVVANGGIETHPETGRIKLNLPTLQSNISYLSLSGGILEQAALSKELQLDSIRHLAVSPEGRVAIAMQWQGDEGKVTPLAGWHERGMKIQILLGDIATQRQMLAYAGSVAISDDSRKIAITSPRGGILQVFDTKTGRAPQSFESADLCGVTFKDNDFRYTTGTGDFGAVKKIGLKPLARHSLAWDNHLVRV